MKGLITRNLHVKYESPTKYSSRDTAKVKVFENRSNFKVKVKSQGHITRNLHVKYESPTTYGSRGIAKVKVFPQTDRQAKN